jgi:DNA polymerase III sliding clamp (beta) subunit (PCNA family)
MSTILIQSNILRDTKRLFGKLRYKRMTLPVLNHILLTAGPDGIRLTVTDLDHWIETRVSTDGYESTSFLIPPDAMDAACRADRGTLVSFTAFGGKRSKDLGLVIRQGSIEATSVHPTLDPKEFPERPDLKGEEITLPPATIQSLAVIAGCASRDATRQILNGVFFTPEDGGRLVATDGRLLAVCPAAVPPHAFVLPSIAVSVLEHPAFISDLVNFTWLEAKDPEIRHVALRCGSHLLVAKTITGTYPNFQQVIPNHAKELVVIPHDRRPGLIAWLRSLKSEDRKNASVRLDWLKRGQLSLTHRDAEGRSSFLHVPVEIHGKPPVIAFNPVYLAQALEIGSTLCLSDELTPGVCRHPNGRFCVIMPMRVTIPAPSPSDSQDAASEDHPSASIQTKAA